MEIYWDPIKQQKLKIERGIDLDEIKALIENEDYLEITENAKHPGQVLFCLEYKGYGTCSPGQT